MDMAMALPKHDCYTLSHARGQSFRSTVSPPLDEVLYEWRLIPGKSLR